ncbi:hypothetical protein RFI_08403, partial [Reticulomyxa filosa]
MLSRTKMANETLKSIRRDNRGMATQKSVVNREDKSHSELTGNVNDGSDVALTKSEAKRRNGEKNEKNNVPTQSGDQTQTPGYVEHSQAISPLRVNPSPYDKQNYDKTFFIQCL